VMQVMGAADLGESAHVRIPRDASDRNSTLVSLGKGHMSSLILNAKRDFTNGCV
jgi:hypothetical protein